MLVLMAYEAFEGDAAYALAQANAIELFHNFSLIHDDIMDNADLRRGAATVHKKFGIPTAILSGDVMLVYAYQEIVKNYPGKANELLDIFNRMAIGVCEGQQLDLDFETMNDVDSQSYLTMIELKTSLLLGTALKIGAVLADAPSKDIERIFSFGLNTGIAFQLMDDVLDTFGSPEQFGKVAGGDIMRNKKTILVMEAMTNATDTQRKHLQYWYDQPPSEDKVNAVKKLFVETHAESGARKLIDKYHRTAIQCLDEINVSTSSKALLNEFSSSLLNRVK